MIRKSLILLLALGLLVPGCDNGDDTTRPSGTTENTFSATIDGVAWKSDTDLIDLYPDGWSYDGAITISGHESSTGREVDITLSFVSGPATLPFGINIHTCPGGFGKILIDPDEWVTPLSAEAGVLKIKVRTDTRIAGTFSFSAAAATGGSPVMREVTEGEFDITVKDGLPPLATRTGSTASAMFDGTRWDMASLTSSIDTQGLIWAGMISTTFQVGLLGQVPITAPGDYGIPSQVQLSVYSLDTHTTYKAFDGPDIGTLHVSTIDDTRLAGAFSATLPDLTKQSSLVVTDGMVNVFLGEY